MLENSNSNEKTSIEDLAAIYEARQKRLKAALGEEKPAFSKNDYAQKLRERLASDNRLIEETQKKRIETALNEWTNRVGSRFSNPKIEKEAVKRIVESRVDNLKNKKFLHRNSLVMTGTLGVGKTWTGYAFLRRLIEEGIMTSSNIIVGTETEIFGEMSSSFDKAELLKELLYRSHKIFFIDDVGTIAPGKTSNPVAVRHELWASLLDHCYREHIPLIITSNLSTKSGWGVENMHPAERYDNQLQAWIGRRAYDRLITITGEDGMIVPGSQNMREIHSKQMDEKAKNQ